MLIQESHKDVPTNANGKEGSMSILVAFIGRLGEADPCRNLPLSPRSKLCHTRPKSYKCLWLVELLDIAFVPGFVETIISQRKKLITSSVDPKLSQCVRFPCGKEEDILA